MTALLDAVQSWASVRAAAPALTTAAQSLSWHALESLIEAAAGVLRRRQVRRLGLLADNGPDWIVADLAAQCAGVPLVPLPRFFTPMQLAHVCTHSGLDAVAADFGVHALLPGCGDGVRFTGGLQLYPRPVAASATLHPGTEKITFTSGTTGAPKGVCLSHAHQHRTARELARLLAWPPGHRHLSALPLAVLLENLAGAWTTLLLGGELVLLSAEEVGLRGSSQFDPGRLAGAINRHRAQSVILLPQMLQALTRWCIDSATRLPSLRLIAVGGSRVAPALLEQAAAAGLSVVEGYGLSECASVVCLNRPGAALPGSVGAPLPHWRISIAPGGDARPARADAKVASDRVALDRVGEILVEGDAFLGYLGEPARGGGPIATGDIGAIDASGRLQVYGRCRNVLISSYGRNLSPEWPESELCQDGAIAQALVFGDERPWCGALIVPRPGADDGAVETAIGRANARLPDYAQIRRWLVVEPFSVAAEELTANGRSRRDPILRRYQAAIDGLYRADAEPGLAARHRS